MVPFSLNHRLALVATALDIRAALVEINRTFLALLVDMAKSPGDASIRIVEVLKDPLLAFESQVDERAAQVPLLLVDLEFRNAPWWEAIAAEASRNVLLPAGEPSSLNARAIQLARATLMLVWHVARTDDEASLIEMGMSAAVASQLAALHPPHIDTIAERHYARLRPRFAERLDLWRQLLCAAPEVSTARAFTLRALTSMAPRAL